MRRLALFSVLALIALFSLTALANADCFGCIFYGGDLDLNDPYQNGLANENDAIVGGNPYGAATYQNFVTNYGFSISGLFTNDLMNASTFVPATAKDRPMAYWEVRKGVSEGNGGTLIASGSGVSTITPTGRSDFGYTEYTNEVDGLNVSLPAGTYWFAVVPQAVNQRPGRSFNSDTDGLNSIGTQITGLQYFNSAFFGANFTNANNEGVFNIFSSGVVSWIPEPSSVVLLGSGALAVVGVVRRRVLR